MMNITRKKLAAATHQNIISAEQADALFAFLQAQTEAVPRFTATHVLYYLGGLMAIGAMTLFMGLSWQSFGSAGIVIMSVIYAVIGLTCANRFSTKGLSIPAGICATFVVCITPLGIYGLQEWLGVWPDGSVYQDYHRYIKFHWLYMGLGTLVVAAIMLRKYKYPFLSMPIVITLWYLALDITSMLASGGSTWELTEKVSLYFGLLMIMLAFWLDIKLRQKADYAFWFYTIGAMAFWTGLTAQYWDSELAMFFYLCINLVMIGVGVLLTRRVFVIFGALGSCGYFGYLAFDVFAESWLFPIALTAIGFGIIYLGIFWQKHEQIITQKTRLLLPAALRELL